MQTDERAALYMERLEEITVSTAHFLGEDRSSGQSFAEEDELMFDHFLNAAGYSPEQGDRARNIRKGVVHLANKMLDAVEADERDPGNDPGCDPGGGMTEPDGRDKGDPW